MPSTTTGRLPGPTAALVVLAVLSVAFAAPARAADAPDVAAGHELFNKWCYGCHAASIKHGPDATLLGSVLAGTYTLQQRYQGSKPAALEERTDLTPALIDAVVRHGRNLMPRTRKTEISDAELAEISAYLTRARP
jgi:mono/diheme cytochrome c family protein